MIFKVKQTIIAAVGVLGLASGYCVISATEQFNPSTDSVSHSSHFLQTEATNLVEAQPRIETKIETVERIVPFETVTTQDASLEKGKTRIIVEGQDGIETVVYQVTYTDGLETSREVTSIETTQSPVDRIIAEGTYVAPVYTTCQNGTYVNSAGQTVCRPSATNTGGATAICRDGSYSYSRSRRGTCSHHGGVSQWL